MKSELIKYCEDAIVEIKESDNKGAAFVRLRLELHDRFFKGFIFSTSLGAEIFQIIIGHLNKTALWLEDGEYGNNFRKAIGKYD